MVKNLSRRTVKFVNVFSLCLASLFFLNFSSFTPSFSPGRSAVLVRTAPADNTRTAPAVNTSFSYADSARLNLLYDSLQLDSLGLSAEAYHKAIAGFLSL